MFMAVTTSEKTNILAASLAKQLGAKRVIARVRNHEYLQPEHDKYFKNIGIDNLISPTMLCSSEILILSKSYSQKIYDIDSEVRENSIVVNTTAMDMIENENYESATRILEAVIQKDPTFHPAYINFYRAGKNITSKTEDVIVVLKDGLEIFEENDEMAYYLGNLYQRDSRFKEAIAAYTDAIAFSKINGEDFPLVWAYHFNRGNCHLKSKDFTAAIPDYDYALTLSPDNPDILTNRGYCFYQSDQKAKACSDWNLAKSFGNFQTQRYLDSFCK
jgi:tetratricopeptide (TPR) repeat protein